MIPKIYCSECNGEISISHKFCSVCGSKIEWEPQNVSAYGLVEGLTEGAAQAIEVSRAGPEQCPLCGFENFPESRFCENCGAGLRGSKVPSSRREGPPLDSSGAFAEEKAKRKKQKSAKPPAQKPADSMWRTKRLPLQPWKLFSIPAIALLIGLAIYGVTSQKEEAHTHERIPAAGTSRLQEIEQLQTIVDANPQDSRSLLRLANRLQDARFLPRAIIYYERYLDLVPADANARVDLGICYFETGDARTAISEMEKALEFEPLHQLAHLNLGIVNLSSGNLQKAKGWFEKCVEINPNREAGKRALRILEQHASIQESALR